MAKLKKSVPAAETGAVAGDYKGSRNYMKMPQGGGQTDGIKKGSHARGAGPAPRPQVSKQPLIGSTAHTAPTQGSLARVQDGGQGDSGLRLPVHHPKANITGSGMPYGGNGQPPAPRGGPVGIRAGGRNQGWPNGAMYTDAIKKGSSGKDSGPVATRKPERRDTKWFYGGR